MTQAESSIMTEGDQTAANTITTDREQTQAEEKSSLTDGK